MPDRKDTPRHAMESSRREAVAHGTWADAQICQLPASHDAVLAPG